jgi:branched-chain amino acid aminotransferase
MTELKIFINGEFIFESKARISPQNHGFLYGDGIFEGIRAYNGRVFKLKEHIDRLYDSAKMIKLNIPYSKEIMMQCVRETLIENKLNKAYIRLIVTRGDGDLGLNPNTCKTPTVIIITKPMDPIADPKGITAVTSSMRRMPISTFSPNIKSLNYLSNVLCKMEANDRGADEGIFLDMNGNVSEGSAENIFMVKNGVLITPPHISSLNGITRQTVIDIAVEVNRKIEIRNFSIFEMYAADEVFMTGTAAELAPVVEIDARKIGDGKPGSITLAIQKILTHQLNNMGTPIESEVN